MRPEKSATLILWWLGIPFYLIVLLNIIFPLLQIGRSYSNPAASMAPTVDKGDWIYTSEITMWFERPVRGSVITFRAQGLTDNIRGTPLGDGTFVKRVVGLPGDTVSIRDGHIWINHVLDPELSNRHYSQLGELDSDDAKIVVPQNAYFVLGDNTADSLDSRFWGCVPAKNIRGVAVLRVWPLTRFGLIR